jgi:hypothetical protein
MKKELMCCPHILKYSFLIVSFPKINKALSEDRAKYTHSKYYKEFIIGFLAFPPKVVTCTIGRSPGS